MRPDFGCGLLDLVFAPTGPELRTALELSVRASIQRWLGELIDVRALDMSVAGGAVRVSLRYTVRRTGAERDDMFEGRP
ncbi:GPW/gp25 family protein [Paractinoplanes durhamensis]